MNLHPRRSLLLLALPLLVALLGCEISEDQRCEDMDDTLRARALQLPRACNQNADCVLVEIRPGYTVASNATPADPDLDDLRRRRVELCGAWDSEGVTYQPVCEARQCAARKTGVIQDPDAGNNDTGGDCTCASDSDCSFGSVCVDSCQCDAVCLDACNVLNTCGQLNAQFGFGQDLETCVELCTANINLSSEIAACVRDATCDTTLACLE